MQKKLHEQVLYAFSVLFGVVTLVFFLFQIQPGDPARMLGGQYADEATLQNIRQDLGLNEPLWKQYVFYLNDLSPISVYRNPNHMGNWPVYKEKNYGGIKVSEGAQSIWLLKSPYLRKSYQTRRPVAEIIRESFPSTFVLACTAMLLATIIGMSLGIYISTKPGTATDQLTIFFSAIGMSSPSFFMAIIVSWLGGFLWASSITIPWAFTITFFVGLIGVYMLRNQKFVRNKMLRFCVAVMGFTVLYRGLHWAMGDTSLSLPGTNLNMTGSLYSIHPFEGEIFTPKNLILPAITLGIRPLAVIVQLTRNAMLEEYQKEYITTARSKGLSKRYLTIRHALPNALNPVLTTMSGWFASMLAGAVFIEFIFGWRGLGLEIYEALERTDLPVIMGIVLLFALIFVVINLMMDMMYPLLDPRMRKK